MPMPPSCSGPSPYAPGVCGNVATEDVVYGRRGHCDWRRYKATCRRHQWYSQTAGQIAGEPADVSAQRQGVQLTTVGARTCDASEARVRPIARVGYRTVLRVVQAGDLTKIESRHVVKRPADALHLYRSLGCAAGAGMVLPRMISSVGMIWLFTGMLLRAASISASAAACPIRFAGT